jgi:cytochrome c biogenesis protein CcmG/thiol:disulfide interchange protein DsbE
MLIGAGLLLAALGPGCGSNSRAKTAEHAEDAVKPRAERKPAPDFTLRDADGRAVRLTDYRGKVVLLNFWATWCGPCKIEIPWFVDFERRNKDRGFAVIGVSMDEDGWDAVKPFVNRLGVNYRMVLGNDDVSSDYGGVEALPTTFLVDREGHIAAVHVGLASRSDFENGIEQLLNDRSVSADRAGAGSGAAGAR